MPACFFVMGLTSLPSKTLSSACSLTIGPSTPWWDLRLLLRRYHELDQLLYETYAGFFDHSVAFDPSCDVVSLCAICAAPLDSVPFFTPLYPWGGHGEVCCECFDGVHR